MRFVLPALLLLTQCVLLEEGDSEGVARQFQTLRLTEDFTCEGAAFGDFNRDGKMDIVSGPYWYEGPKFEKKHEVYAPEKVNPLGYSDNFFAYAYDFNQDGWNDILVLPFPGRIARWYENQKGGAKHWTRHNALEGVDNESPTFTDLTGDGEPEIVCMKRGRFGYAGPGDGWKFHAISPGKRGKKYTHGLGVGDVDGDGRMDVLERTGWWQQPRSLEGDPVWKHHPVDFGGGGAQMFAYDVDGDGDNDVVTVLEAHGFGLAWFEQTRGRFVRHLIMGSKVASLHALAVADMNGDGLLDLVTGKRHWAHGPTGDPDSDKPPFLHWFELRRNESGVEFVPHLIHDASGVGTDVRVGDVNGDNLPDVVVGNKLGTFVHLQSTQSPD